MKYYKNGDKNQKQKKLHKLRSINHLNAMLRNPCNFFFAREMKNY